MYIDVHCACDNQNCIAVFNLFPFLLCSLNEYQVYGSFYL